MLLFDLSVVCVDDVLLLALVLDVFVVVFVRCSSSKSAMT